MCFKKIEPSILYMGTPVVLITTVDENGRVNIGPMSSAWTTGRTVVLGLLCNSKTFGNLLAQKECVLNYPSSELHEQVEKIARLTGLCPVPPSKQDRYRYSPDKFSEGNFTAMESEQVEPPRIAECSIQLEAELKDILYITDDPVLPVKVAAVCVRVVCVHAREDIIIKEKHIDPRKWDPLIYNFRHYFGLGPDLGKTFKAEI